MLSYRFPIIGISHDSEVPRTFAHWSWSWSPKIMRFEQIQKTKEMSLKDDKYEHHKHVETLWFCLPQAFLLVHARVVWTKFEGFDLFVLFVQLFATFVQSLWLTCWHATNAETLKGLLHEAHLGLKWLHCCNELQCTAGVRLEIVYAIVLSRVKSIELWWIQISANYFAYILWRFMNSSTFHPIILRKLAFSVRLLQALYSVWLALSDDTKALKLSVPEQGPWTFCDLWLEVFGGPWANSPDQPWQLCNQPWLILARGLLSLTER